MGSASSIACFTCSESGRSDATTPTPSLTVEGNTRQEPSPEPADFAVSSLDRPVEPPSFSATGQMALSCPVSHHDGNVGRAIAASTAIPASTALHQRDGAGAASADARDVLAQAHAPLTTARPPYVCTLSPPALVSLEPCGTTPLSEGTTFAPNGTEQPQRTDNPSRSSGSSSSATTARDPPSIPSHFDSWTSSELLAGAHLPPPDFPPMES